MIKKVFVVVVGLMLMGMVGCSKDEPETAADKVKKSLHNASEATKEMAHDAAKATEDAAHDAKEAMK